MQLTENVKFYLRCVATIYVEANDEHPEYNDDAKDAAWERMTGDEKDTANELVEAIFGPWLDMEPCGRINK